MSYSNRRLRNGYSNFGAIAIPPLPSPIILTDRDDGTKWLVSFDITTSPPVDGYGRIMINSVYGNIGRRDGIAEYAAGDEPYLEQDGQYKLIVREGRLGFEFIPFEQGNTDNDGMKLYARLSGTRSLRRIYLSESTHNSMRTPAWTPDDE